MIIVSRYDGSYPRSVHDFTSLYVTEELNGAYTLDATYVIGSVAEENCKLNGLIECQPHEGASSDLFRIKNITTNIDGTVSLYAEHISYDLSGEIVAALSETTGAAASVAQLVSDAGGLSGWTISTDITDAVTTFKVEAPGSFRSLLMADDGSIRAAFGGDLQYSGRTVTLKTKRGLDRGVQVSYGWNMAAMKDEQSTEPIYSAILAFWQKDEVVSCSQELGITTEIGSPRRVYLLDCTEMFEDEPTYVELNAVATQAVTELGLGKLTPGMTASVVNSGNDSITLGDTVHAHYIPGDIHADLRVTRVVYNVLSERTETYDLGYPTQSIVNWLLKKQTQARKSAGELKNGWYDDGVNRYYYINGARVKGWLDWSGNKYYMDLTTGAMQTGWQDISGNRYWFDTTTGIMAIGWSHANTVGYWYFFDRTSGIMQTGWLVDNGNRYSLTESGASIGVMRTGWYAVGGKWYYFHPTSGAAFIGLHSDVPGDSHTYYFYANDAHMAANENITVGGVTYHADANGYCTIV